MSHSQVSSQDCYGLAITVTNLNPNYGIMERTEKIRGFWRKFNFSVKSVHIPRKYHPDRPKTKMMGNDCQVETTSSSHTGNSIEYTFIKMQKTKPHQAC